MLLLTASVVGISQLASATISPLIILWIALPLAGLPMSALLVYHLYGLLTARYHLDRDGFSLRWGLAVEQVPIAKTSIVKPPPEFAGRPTSVPSLWWPGLTVGRRHIPGVGEVEFFATTGPQGIVLLRAGDRHMAISPADAGSFRRSFTEMSRFGSLKRIPELSRRPNFLLARLWSHRLARALLLLGLLLPLSLLGYLAVLSPGLPDRVPFGFDLQGQPSILVPPGRLLLLPFVGTLCWFVDALVGAWLYRQEGNRILAFASWVCSLIVGAVLWGGVLHLLAVR